MIKNLLITYLFLITNVFAGLPPTTMRGQSQTLKPTTFNFQVPNKQATITAASTSLIETGNNNELENRGFEHTTVTTGWTVSNATSSSSTTRIEGSKSLSLALTGALSLSQSSTINASQKSGVQMVASIWVNSSDVSDLQLCSLKNGVEDKCTVTGGYVQGSGWRQLTVSFLGDSTSNGLKLKSTDTTGTVLVDQAYVGIGSPVVDFTTTTDWETYTPTVTNTSNATATAYWKRIGDSIEVTGKITWSGSGGSTNNPIVSIPSGLSIDGTKISTDTIVRVPTGNAVYFNSGSTLYPARSFYQSSTTIVLGTLGNGTANDISNALLVTPKAGDILYFNFKVPIAGWAGKSSKAYVASSSDTDWASCGHTTSDFTGFGTVTGIETQCKREGSDLLMRGKFTSGVTTAVEARVNLKLNGSILTSQSSPSIASVQLAGYGNLSVVTANQYNILIEPSVTYFTLGIQNSANSGQTKRLGNQTISSGETLSFFARIPISGWTDSGVIVGSFQGYNETPGTSRVETFSVSYGTTNATTVCSASPCSYLDQIGNAVTSITRTGTGAYSINLSKTFSKLKCTAVVGAPGVGFLASPFIGTNNGQCSNCSSLPLSTANGSSSPVDSNGTLYCQGIPQ